MKDFVPTFGAPPSLPGRKVRNPIFKCAIPQTDHEMTEHACENEMSACEAGIMALL